MTEPTYNHIAIHPIADGRGVHLALSGEIDLAAHDDVRDSIVRAVREPTEYVVVDLDHVTFLDCSGIRALLTGLDAAVPAGCGLEIVNAHGLVRRILDLTGVLDELGARSLTVR